jgi:hypothetical protein
VDKLKDAADAIVGPALGTFGRKIKPYLDEAAGAVRKRKRRRGAARFAKKQADALENKGEGKGNESVDEMKERTGQ